jgi:thiamine pyrophosphokinase
VFPPIFHRASEFQVEDGVENAARVLGVLSGGDIDIDLLRRWAASANHVLAADGGADLLLRVGTAPHVVIGDMDSVSEKALKSAPQVLTMPDQDATDCDKLLAFAAKEGYGAITLAGVEGDLPDHVLAILQSATKAELDVRLAYRRGIGWIVRSGDTRTVTGRLRRVSLLPIDRCEAVTLKGTQWPLANANLSPRGLTSISNRALGGEVSASVGSGAALLFVEFAPEEMPFWS